mmetsp:Transcript_35763/g.90653  ORF Transcript_35763/g.90653 Transcript_35763/m.90653 type:complete len:225 (+) Transcript_35763:158-832(+)
MLDGLLLLLARGQAGEELALPPGEDGLLHRRLVRHLHVRHELRRLLLRLFLLLLPRASRLPRCPALLPLGDLGLEQARLRLALQLDEHAVVVVSVPVVVRVDRLEDLVPRPLHLLGRSLLEEVAHAGQPLGRAVVLVPLPRHHLLRVLVQQLRSELEVVRPSQGLDLSLPVPLFSHQLVDRVVEVSHAVLLEPLVLDERHLLRDLLDDLVPVHLTIRHVSALGR